MRYNIKKKNSTKAERIVYEILKRLRVPFRHRWIIQGKEIDFVVGCILIEIDGHEQDPPRNHSLVESGYVPIHFTNQEIIENRDKIKLTIKNLL